MPSVLSVTLISPFAAVLTGGTTWLPFRWASNLRPNGVCVGEGDGVPFGVPVGEGEGVPFGVPVGEGDGEGVEEPPKVPERTAEPLLFTVMVEPTTTGGTIWALSLRSRNSASPPLCSVMLPTGVPSTITLSVVPIGRLTWRTRTSSSVRLLCTSNSAKPRGTTPFSVGPVRFAKRSPLLFGVPVGEGEGVPLGVPVGDGEGVPFGVPVGDGEGVPFGVPVGDGEGVAPPLPKTPSTTTVFPLRTCMTEPSFTTGTVWPFCERSVISALRKESTINVATLLPSINAVRVVPAGKLRSSTSISSSRWLPCI